MSFPFLGRWKRRNHPELNGPETAFLHDKTRFRALLECERMRADRSRSKFSLAVFSFSQDEAGLWNLLRFAPFLKSRVRATDHPGFLDNRRIGVILWDTGEVGAWKFVDAVTGAEGAPPIDKTEAYVYPTYEAPPKPGGAADDDEGQQTLREINDLLQTVCCGLQPVRPVQRLELLFIQKLPWWKRGIDLLGATFGLLMLSPLLMAVALVIKLTSRGPVLFRQTREGLGGRLFTIYKFRTMCVDAEAKKAALRAQSEQDGPAFKMAHDPRITRLGRWLRKSCVDELPQLWNVVKGDMTLVGPRPLDVKESQHIEGWKRRRLEVTPGLTCIWQVHGKSKVPFVEWMRMDIRYMRARSLMQDLKLVFETIVSVILHRASQ